MKRSTVATLDLLAHSIHHSCQIVCCQDINGARTVQERVSPLEPVIDHTFDPNRAKRLTNNRGVPLNTCPRDLSTEASGILIEERPNLVRQSEHLSPVGVVSRCAGLEDFVMAGNESDGTDSHPIADQPLLE